VENGQSLRNTYVRKITIAPNARLKRPAVLAGSDPGESSAKFNMVDSDHDHRLRLRRMDCRLEEARHAIAGMDRHSVVGGGLDLRAHRGRQEGPLNPGSSHLLRQGAAHGHRHRGCRGSSRGLPGAVFRQAVARHGWLMRHQRMDLESRDGHRDLLQVRRMACAQVEVRHARPGGSSQLLQVAVHHHSGLVLGHGLVVLLD